MSTNLPDVEHSNAAQPGHSAPNQNVAGRKKARQCEHVKVNGEFCGSPALRGRNYCYFHLNFIGRRMRAERAQFRATAFGVSPLQLPPLEDANSIQMALTLVIDAILDARINERRAGLVLYALQTASANLARTELSHASKATVADQYEEFEKDFGLEDRSAELHSLEREEDGDGRGADLESTSDTPDDGKARPGVKPSPRERRESARPDGSIKLERAVLSQRLELGLPDGGLKTQAA